MDDPYLTRMNSEWLLDKLADIAIDSIRAMAPFDTDCVL